MLRSIGFKLVDKESRSSRQIERMGETEKKAWYEGQYVISPNSTWYQLWDMTKSIGYMISLYTLAYDAAFMFESGTKTETFERLIDMIQIVDIVHTFFTAKKVRSLSIRVQQLKKREL
jgi:hypothetical protein